MKNPWLDIPLDDYEGHMAFSPVQLMFAGLFFEYVDPCAALNRIRQAMLIPGGTLVSVVQLPSDEIPEVTLLPTPGWAAFPR